MPPPNKRVNGKIVSCSGGLPTLHALNSLPRAASQATKLG